MFWRVGLCGLIRAETEPERAEHGLHGILGSGVGTDLIERQQDKQEDQ